MNILSVVTAVSSVGLLLIVSSTQKDSISPKHISVKTILHWDQYATFQGKEKKNLHKTKQKPSRCRFYDKAMVLNLDYTLASLGNF